MEPEPRVWSHGPGRRNKTNSNFRWTDLLKPGDGVRGVPVSSFSHAPLAKYWEKICPIGLKAEVKLPENASKIPGAHWIVTVMEFCGYLAHVRYEGLDDDASKDIWVHINALHPIGYCDSTSNLLATPIGLPRGDDRGYWVDYITNRLTQRISLHKQLDAIIDEDLRLRRGLSLSSIVEFTELERDSSSLPLSQVGRVAEAYGRRLLIKTFGCRKAGFWCHEFCSTLHNPGWSSKVGHVLKNPSATAPKCVREFAEPYKANEKTNLLLEGRVFECVHPLRLNQIVPAKIDTVLKDGYFMACALDESKSGEHENPWFCCHVDSPLVLPCGFCKTHGIDLDISAPYKALKGRGVNWDLYMIKMKTCILNIKRQGADWPSALSVGFRAGLKLEAVNLNKPHLIAPATVVHVSGHLVRIRFDGWDESDDQWMHVESPDLYPVGWSEVVGRKLETPREPSAPVIDLASGE